MKIKLTSLEEKFVPSVFFETEDGKINNRNNTPEDQVVCEITLADAGQKLNYTAGYTTYDRKTKSSKTITDFQYKKCIRKHCGKIEGLEDFGITDGKSLCDTKIQFRELNDIVESLFNHICGLDDEEEFLGE